MQILEFFVRFVVKIKHSHKSYAEERLVKSP